MSLADYVAAQRGRATSLASALTVSPVLVSQWASGARPVPEERCPLIERATDGAVTAERLRPDVRWVRVADAAWPHPDGRPCIDVASPELISADGALNVPAADAKEAA